MKISILIITMMALAFSVRGQDRKVPETIDLGQKPASFTDLQSNKYDVILLRANLDGVVYTLPKHPGSVRVLNFTNISAADLEKWHIPTNRIELAAQRAAAKGKSDRVYKANVTAQSQALEEQQAKELAEWKKNRPAREAQARKEMEAKSEAERDAVIEAQRETVIRLKRENDRLWQKYVDGPGNAVYVIGGPDDPDAVRSRRIASDSALRAARERLEDMESGRVRN